MAPEIAEDMNSFVASADESGIKPKHNKMMVVIYHDVTKGLILPVV